MKVYVLEGLIPHEGNCLMGVYSSEGAADAAKEVYILSTKDRINIYDNYQITEVEIDQFAVTYF
jgi:hypothetical protein